LVGVVGLGEATVGDDEGAGEEVPWIKQALRIKAARAAVPKRASADSKYQSSLWARRDVGYDQDGTAASVGVLAGVESFGGGALGLITYEDPAEIASRVIQPVFDIRHHLGSGTPGELAGVADIYGGASGGHKIAVQHLPEVGVEFAVVPGGVAGGGGGALTSIGGKAVELDLGQR
jgi:hypothetical protein